MVEELVVYPDKRIEIPSPDVREFGPKLAQIITNLKDTIQHHNAEGLAAMQCAIPAAVVVIKKEDGSYLELINPRILKSEGKVDSVETTLYLPGVTETVPRYEKIKLVYQDREGQQHGMDVDGKLSLLIQRKVDYIYGGSFATKLADKKKKDITQTMSDNGIKGSLEACPLEPMRKDYLSSFMSKILGLGFIMMIIGLFVSDETAASLQNYISYIVILLPFLIVGFYFLGLSDSKKYSSCTSCQIGNLLGTMARFSIFTLILWAASHFLLAP
jgi:peptide deformylase